MIANKISTPKARKRSACRRAFTLIEFVASMVIMLVLMGAMTSVIVLASHAMPDSESLAAKKTDAMQVVAKVSGELFYATMITEATANAVTFTVADRGHGSTGPEVIRYAWSGTPGDPLTRQYNGGSVVTAYENVQLFDLVYEKGVGHLDAMPRVLYLHDPVGVGPPDTVRMDAFTSWGFPYQILPANSSKAAYDMAVPNCDVIYVNSEVNVDVSTQIKGLAKGIVCEDGKVLQGLGVGNSVTWFWSTDIDVVSNAHEVTAPFAIGPLTIADTDQKLLAMWQGIASGADILANAPFFGDTAMVAIEPGGALYNGGTAAGRRFALPWGSNLGFDITAINANGMTLMRRSIAWAAAPVVYTGVSVGMQSAGVPEPLRSQVQILNTPAVSVP